MRSAAAQGLFRGHGLYRSHHRLLSGFAATCSSGFAGLAALAGGCLDFLAAAAACFARNAAHRFFVACAIHFRPAALILRFFLAGAPVSGYQEPFQFLRVEVQVLRGHFIFVSSSPVLPRTGIVVTTVAPT